jgi:hypothetical protein
MFSNTSHSEHTHEHTHEQFDKLQNEINELKDFTIKTTEELVNTTNNKINEAKNSLLESRNQIITETKNEDSGLEFIMDAKMSDIPKDGIISKLLIFRNNPLNLENITLTKKTRNTRINLSYW